MNTDSDASLLDAPLLGTISVDGTPRALSLPEVLAELDADRVEGFSGLSRHQAPAWHMFCVQLAAIACHRGGAATPPVDADGWRTLLRALTPRDRDDAPWRLSVADVAKPAFLQPPIPEGSLAGYRGRALTPDAIDVLVNAKNHDVKQARFGKARPEHWVYALVSLQTTQGFLGQGNYGIARMNGGYGSRVCFTLTYGQTFGAVFRRDLRVLLDQRDSVFRRHAAYPASGGLGLLWLEPWDGNAALALSQLDPWFIEVCRRVRLVRDGERLVCLRTGTTMPRVAARERRGDLGDPWCPVDRAAGAAITVSDVGLDHRLLARVMFGAGHEPALLQRSHAIDDRIAIDDRLASDGQPELLARVLVRGQGETGGYHERRLPIPRGLRRLLDDSPERAEAQAVVQQRLEEARSVAVALQWGLMTLFQGGPATTEANHRDARRWADVWVADFDRWQDETFFEALWRELAASGGARADARESWHTRLLDAALETLTRATWAMPRSQTRRHRAELAGREAFLGVVGNRLPQVAGKHRHRTAASLAAEPAAHRVVADRSPGSRPPSRPLLDDVARVVGHLAGAAVSPAERALLRRLPLRSGKPAVFWTVMRACALERQCADPAGEAAWGLAVRCLARLDGSPAGTAAPGGPEPLALGTALARAGVSPTALNRLLGARGEPFEDAALAACERLALAPAPVQAVDLGVLALTHPREPAGIDSRRAIVESYWDSVIKRETSLRRSAQGVTEEPAPK